MTRTSLTPPRRAAAAATMASIGVGDTLGRYEIVEEIGQGGMSVVYRALDVQLKREVAVKVMHGFLADQPEARERFHREAVAVARLKHPHIIEIFDYSGEEAEAAYIVAELVTGKSLAEYLAQHAISPPEAALALARPIADALAHAHAHGVVHRDLKPENILVGDNGSLKLTDFGIARMLDNHTLTITGTLLGSPAFMAPEYIEGREPDERADLFSFGAMIYQMLSGTLPFSAPSPHALLKRIASGEYTPVNQLNPHVHCALANLVHHCLERTPEARTPSAEALRDEIDCILNRLEISAQTHRVALLTQQENYADSLESTLATTYIDLGKAALAQGKHAEAMDDFDRVLSLQPDNVEVRGILDRLTRRRWVRASTARAGTLAAIGLFGAMVTTLLGVLGVSIVSPLFATPPPVVIEAPAAPTVARKRNVSINVTGTGRLEIDGKVAIPWVENDILVSLEMAPGEHIFRLIGKSDKDVVVHTVPETGSFDAVQLTTTTQTEAASLNASARRGVTANGAPVAAETPAVEAVTRTIQVKHKGWVTLYVDDESTPRVEREMRPFALKLTDGEHRLKFLNDFSKQKVVSLVVNESQPPGGEMFVELELRDAHLMLKDVPAGDLVVTVAGKRHAVTELNKAEPILVPVQKNGEKKWVIVQKKGFHDFSTQVGFAAGQPRELPVALRAMR